MTDPGKRRALADLYREAFRFYVENPDFRVTYEPHDLRAQQLTERLCQQLEICEEDEPATREQLGETRERVRVETSGAQGFRVIFTNAEDVGELDRDLVTSFGDLREAARTGTTVTLELRDDSLETLRETSVEQARETIANRIDEMGLREAAVMTRSRPTSSSSSPARPRRSSRRSARSARSAEQESTGALPDSRRRLQHAPTRSRQTPIGR